MLKVNVIEDRISGNITNSGIMPSSQNPSDRVTVTQVMHMSVPRKSDVAFPFRFIR